MGRFYLDRKETTNEEKRSRRPEAGMFRRVSDWKSENVETRGASWGIVSGKAGLDGDSAEVDPSHVRKRENEAENEVEDAVVAEFEQQLRGSRAEGVRRGWGSRLKQFSCSRSIIRTSSKVEEYKIRH